MAGSYKKIPLRFREEIARDKRHAETLRTRESSRFKRLSNVRNIDLNDENPKEENIMKPISRLEQLRKWKEDREMRKKLEVQNKQRPFYAGRSTGNKNESLKNCQNFKSSFINANKSTYNSSNISIFQRSRIVNTKLPAPSTTVKNSIKLPAPSTVVKHPIKTPAVVSQPSAATKNFKGMPSHLKPQSSATAKFQSSIPPRLTHLSSATAKTSTSIPTRARSQLPTSVKTSKPVTSIPTIPRASSIPKNSRMGMPEFKKPLPKPAVPKPTASFRTKPKTENNLKIPNKKPSKGNDEKQYKLHQQVSTIIPEFDVSTIKPTASFAPDGFKFQAPYELSFFIDDEGLAEVLAQFTSRTSTPSRPCDESNFATRNIKKSSLFQKEDAKESEILKEIDNTKTSETQSVEENQDNKSTSVQLINIKDTDISDHLDISTAANQGKNNESSNEDMTCLILKNEQTIESVPDSLEKKTLENGIEAPTSDSETTSLNDVQLELVDITQDDIEKKNTGAIPKRISMRKRISTLNSITETDEDCVENNLKNEVDHFIGISRRSRRSIIHEENLTPQTPRRSLRLKKNISSNLFDSPKMSPFKNYQYSGYTPRHSMQLRSNSTNSDDLSSCSSPMITDSRACGATSNITKDFENLHLSEVDENTDPNFLIKFESPENWMKSQAAENLTSRKISLLYSPEKSRNSFRRSIRGDLITFSPKNT